MASNKQVEATQLYQNILSISPLNRQAITALAKIHIQKYEYKKAEALLLKLGQHSKLQTSDYRLLAKTVRGLQKKAESHLYLAEALILEKQYEPALEELRQAQQQAMDNFYINNRIEARMTEMLEKIQSTEKVP